MRARGFIFGLLLSLAACTAVPSSPVRQEIAGVINRDLTLAGEVLLTGDLLLLPGCTLTLRPGTTVRIRSAESTKIDPEYLSSATEILIRGRLLAEGTAGAPISFLPESAQKTGEIAWAGIILDRAAASTLQHTRIEGAEQGLLAIATSPQIHDNAIRGCRYGIVIQGEGNPTLRNNRIEAGEGGIFILAGAAPEVSGNHISRQAEEGLFVDAVSSPHLGRNEIRDNAIGLVLHNPGLPFERSGINGNREDLRLIGGL